MLDKIREQDIRRTDDCDRVFASLKLDDYDWMSYQLEAQIPTKRQGMLSVIFEYYGAQKCEMRVVQDEGEQSRTYTYLFSAALFKKHISEYMVAHVSNWTAVNAFNAEPHVVRFFNAVLSHYIEYHVGEEAYVS